MTRNALDRFIKPLFNIHKDEFSKVLLLFFNFYLIVTTHYIVKSIRGSLVIEKLGADSLPYIWGGTVVVLGFFIHFYSKLVDKFQRHHVMIITNLFFIANLICFKTFSDFDSKWITVCFYIWGDIFSVVMVEQFWSFTNDVFQQKDAKRLYGIIGSGGILGGATGSALVGLVVPVIGTTNMVFVCIGVLALLMMTFFALQNITMAKIEGISKPISKKKQKVASFLNDSKLVFNNNYLRNILLAIVLIQVISTLIDFQFNKIVELNFTSVDDRSSFFGKFYFWMNILSLSIMLFMTVPLNRKFGILAGLLALPLVNFVGAALFLAMPIPMVMFALKMADKSIIYSINRATREILYIPAPRELRYKAKAIIDMFGYRASKILGAALIIPFTSLFALKHLTIVSLGLITCLIIVTVKLGRMYFKAYRWQLKNSVSPEYLKLAEKILDESTLSPLNQIQIPMDLNGQQISGRLPYIDEEKRLLFSDLKKRYKRKDIEVAYACYLDPNFNSEPDNFLYSLLKGDDKEKIQLLLEAHQPNNMLAVKH